MDMGGCFSKIPIGKEEVDELRTMRYKLCLVFPGLERRNQDIENYKSPLENSKSVLTLFVQNIQYLQMALNGLFTSAMEQPSLYGLVQEIQPICQRADNKERGNLIDNYPHRRL